MNAPRDSSAVGASDDARAGVGATAGVERGLRRREPAERGRQPIDDEDTLTRGAAVIASLTRPDQAEHTCVLTGSWTDPVICAACLADNRAPIVPYLFNEPAARGGALREADGRPAVPGELAAVKREVVLDVFGTPAPKGSSRAVLIAGKPQVVPNSSTRNAREQRAWVKAVRDAWAKAWGKSDAVTAFTVMPFVDTPLVVEIAFRLERPKSHWRKSGLAANAPARPLGKPDVDKLARCTIDALTGYVFDDDSRVSLLMVAKDYADPGYEGARIVVRERGL